MAVVIVLYDQLVFRPVVAWSDKFRVELVAAQAQPQSWVLDLISAGHGCFRRSAISRAASCNSSAAMSRNLSKQIPEPPRVGNAREQALRLGLEYRASGARGLGRLVGLRLCARNAWLGGFRGGGRGRLPNLFPRHDPDRGCQSHLGAHRRLCRACGRPLPSACSPWRNSWPLFRRTCSSPSSSWASPNTTSTPISGCRR